MDDFLKRLGMEEEYGLHLSGSIHKDNLVEAVEKCIQERHISLVVMGTHGSTGGAPGF